MLEFLGIAHLKSGFCEFAASHCAIDDRLHTTFKCLYSHVTKYIAFAYKA